MRPEFRRFGQLLSQGPRNLLWLIYAVCIATWVHRFLEPGHELCRRYVRRRRNGDAAARMIALRQRVAQGQWRRRPNGHRIALAAVSPELEEICRPLRTFQKEIALADVDQDGFLAPRYGAIWAGPLAGAGAGAEPFLHRRRFDVTVVDWNGSVGVRKDFRGDSTAFVNELEAALDLGARGCNVPEVLDMDFERLAITFAYVHGIVVREALAQAGAPLRDRDLRPIGYRALERIRAYWLDRKRASCGRRLIERVLDKATIAGIEGGLRAIHRAGYSWGDIKYGNVIIQSGTRLPYFIDFEYALPLNQFPRATATYVRDRDSSKLNFLFGTELPTAKGLRRVLATQGDTYVYAPFYVGSGVHWGAFWNPDVGIQRWRHMLAEHVPVPRGGHVLDLGANNGFNALQMLRAGAREVVGIEIDPAMIEQGLFVKRICEWADNTEYLFSYIRGSHGDIGSMNLGKFDLVTAFCTLYYLSEAGMAQTVRDIASMTDVLVLQCNDEQWIGRAEAATFKKASLRFNVELLRANGFPHIDVIKRRGSHRPLIIGRTHLEKPAPGETIDEIFIRDALPKKGEASAVRAQPYVNARSL